MEINYQELKKSKRGPMIHNEIAHERAVERYYKNPNHCVFCNKIIELTGKRPPYYYKNIKKFCGQKCYNEDKKLKTADLHKFDRKKVLVTFGPFKLKKECTPGQVCYHAKKVYRTKFKAQECELCGYNKLIDVAHVKAVHTFDDDTMLIMINTIDNLIGLCPNHHKEFDYGLLPLETIQAAINSRQ